MKSLTDDVGVGKLKEQLKNKNNYQSFKIIGGLGRWCGQEFFS
jgi:hypothetical protein